MLVSMNSKVLVCFLTYFSSFCVGNDEKDCSLKNTAEKVKLYFLLTRPDLMLKYQENKGKQIVFIETSGRDYLDTREACAIESGARSNLKGMFNQ